MSDNKAKLRQDLGLADICAIGLSAAIGVSIFSVVAPAAGVAGPAMLIALGCAAVPMVLFAIVYAFMTIAVPRTGASYVWPTLFIHPLVGFLIGWLRIIGCAGGLYIMATVFTGYLQRLVDVPYLPVVLIMLTLPLILNFFGGGFVGRVARVLVVLKLIALTCFIAYGLPQIESANLVPFAPAGLLGIGAAIPLLVGLFTGIESAAEAGEEIRNRGKVIAKGLAIASTIAFLIYLGTFLVTVGVLGAPVTAVSYAPVGDAGQALGNWTGPLILMTALLSITAAMNALMMIFARFLFAMGRDGALPQSLGKLNARFGTPHIALLVAYLFSIACLLLPDELLFLFLAANLPTMLKYGANCFASILLLRRQPELHLSSGFGMKRRPLIYVSAAGVFCSVLMMGLGATADWRPYALLGAWAILGVVYWWFVGRRAT
ncbi:APC family permease [Kordiimonas pumila]|uniref:APC family permease n=2 Tax=Kordiimonas pumila TaxID=2161677 RepID=A0ABV7D6Q7_9PROT|nr:amino acid permease [Kordiimonas pumila]